MNIAEIKAMSTLERMQTMEMLWDSLILDEKEIKSPAWHAPILKQRKLDMESGASKAIPLAQVKRMLKK